MTEASQAERLASLQARRSVPASGAGRRRPAEASRVLVAGAGVAAALTMVASMALKDQQAAVVDMPAALPALPTPSAALSAPDTASAASPITAAQSEILAPVRTVTIARPAAPATVRTHGSR